MLRITKCSVPPNRLAVATSKRYMCAAPTWLLENYNGFFDSADPRANTQSFISHSTSAQEIVDDEDERTTAFLFVMPEGVLINTDMDDFEVPTTDQNVRI